MASCGQTLLRPGQNLSIPAPVVDDVDGQTMN